MKIEQQYIGPKHVCMLSSVVPVNSDLSKLSIEESFFLCHTQKSYSHVIHVRRVNIQKVRREAKIRK